MKTTIKTKSLIVALTVLLSLNLNASVLNFPEESYIDDIPFNLTEIYNEIIAEQNLAEFDFEEEEYINDIPFDSGFIALDNEALDFFSEDFQFEEEAYIDDIPFDTECISANCKYQKAISVEFNFEEEEYIDDINF